MDHDVNYITELISGNYSNITSQNITSFTDEIIYHPVTQSVILFEYLIIFLLGVVGNCLVCFVVFRNKHMQTVTNYFITNLALADILLCVLAVPFTPLYFFMGRWIFGSLLCTLVAMAQGTSVYVSTLTLTSIAVDRYFVIIYPFRPKLQLKVCYGIIIGIWMFSVSATLPYTFYVSQREFESVNYCEEFWPTEFIRKVFSLFTTVMQFVIPFIIILFCYVMISIRMSERIRSKPGCRGSRKEVSDREKKKRTNRMLIAMVTIFIVCWLPVNIIHLIGDYFATASHSKYFNLCFFITHIVAMSSTCYNPFLYAWLNENFRKEFQQVLPCFKKNSGINSRRSRYRSERTCNGNETIDEVLPNHRALDSFAANTCEPVEGGESINVGRKTSQGATSEEVIHLTTLKEEPTTNGEVHDSNGDSTPLDLGPENISVAAL